MTTTQTRQKTVSDLEAAARQLAARLTRIRPEHHAAEVRDTLGPIASAIASGAAAEIEKARTIADNLRAQLRTARPIAPPGYSDSAQVVVRELRRHRLLDRLEALPDHLRVQTIRQDIAAGRFDRLDALLDVDEHGEIVSRADLETLRLERGRAVAPNLAAKMDQAEADLEATISAAHQLGIDAVRALRKAGLNGAEELIDRSAFMGRPTPPTSFREHVEAERKAAEAEPAPAA